MKIALILPNNVWFCPYASIYSKLFEKHHVEYDVISWNRSGVSENSIQFNYKPKNRNPLFLLWYYQRYASFVKRTIKNNGYDKLIVFTPQIAIFLSDFLKKEFKNKYIFDYRDLSIEQKAIFNKPFIRVLKNSFANIISSLGFTKYLPKGFNYILSHNFDIDIVREALNRTDIIQPNRSPIDILTIGGIRDYESNVQVINSLSNVDGFIVRFVGKGPSAEKLQETAVKLNAINVFFEGYYPKEKEREYIEKSTFINIYYPRKPSHDTALSNRFYSSLIYGKPMITTANTTQGNYAAGYNVGIALDNCDNLSKYLEKYLDNMDFNQYLVNRKKLLVNFLEDYNNWESVIKHFLEI